MLIYNYLTGKKEPFIHSKSKPIKLYVCGITPYDTTHLGHAATYVFFDVLVRYLKYKGFKVNYVQNVTDIDDDILREAKKAGQDWKALGDKWTKRYLEDMKSLNVLPPTHFVKATDSITIMIRIIEVLLRKGFAYERDGNVYFEVRKFKDFGKLSSLDRQKMLILLKERGGDPDDPFKKDALDFLLWQSANWRTKSDQPFWQSPWGAGRPGWHIECSAMINQYLGATIDIHGGGHDLIFPHHESEIAQSESYTEKAPFSKFFLYKAMVFCDGKKMSKSLGNLVLVSDLLKKYSPNAIRWYLLSYHYRDQFDFNEDLLVKAQYEVERIEKNIRNDSGQVPLQRDPAIGGARMTILSQFEGVLDDEFNTPAALTLLKKYPYRSIFETLGFVVK